MKLLDKQVTIRHQADRAPVCGFISYISRYQPVLQWRVGWEVGDDVHDDFTDYFSTDNGRTWSEPRPSFKVQEVEGGYVNYIEFAALFHAERNLLITVTNQKFEHSLDHCDLSEPSKLYIEVIDPSGQRSTPPALLSNFGREGYLCVSFAVPILDSRGRILVPVQWQKEDTDGSIRRQGYPTIAPDSTVLQNVWECGLLIGEFGAGDEIDWRLGGGVPLAFEASSRGIMEPALTELPGGRLVMVCRGSNAGWPDKPGYKWLTFSDDHGETWSRATPLPCDDGSVIESSSTGSGLFRSEKNGKLYWIGNLCIDGERSNGNMPRSPLLLAEVQEEPFALKRDSFFVIDRRTPEESPEVQHSNFKFYQDRETGDLVLYLTRYGERGTSGTDWMKADQYRYRVEL